MPWMECVPNVSEGRRAEVIDACANAIRGSGAILLDVSSDPDHNRTVYTCAGDDFTTAAAVRALFDRAIALIDLNHHTGVHPRLGAVDVVPFVPLEDTPMAVCVALARTVAADVAARYQLPVYLYEDAALLADRRRLEVIRGSGFEGLAARLRDPAWKPDFGPLAPHPTAGGTVIGARRFLVAYNVNLNTDRLDVAQRIARAVRTRDGGLPFVKALGLRLARHNLVQVSMNLTRIEVTSIQQAFDAVAREATAEGVGIVDSEIVGLAPRDALSPAIAAAVKLRPQDWDRALEVRLDRARGLRA